MPRGKKNETEIETGVMPTDNVEEQTSTEQTESVSDGVDNSTEGTKETETVETLAPVTAEDPDESAAEDKDSESTSTDESAQATEESEGSAEPSEKKEEEAVAPKLAMLKGNFKVYRGRNLATITAMTATVVPSGDVIVENGVKWLPVIFTSKSGKVANGFIVVR